MNNQAALTTITCQTLRELWLHVIYRCNLSCTHCLFACAPGKEGPGELTFEECKDLVLTAHAENAENVYITGGEPMLWKPLRKFLDWYYSLDNIVPITILTNGTLIDDKMAEFLSRYASQGLNVRISLECYTQQTNDEFRGDGSYHKTIKGIRSLNNHGVRPWVAYVNKSGGGLDCFATKQLENDFRARLGEEHGLEIAGLKVIAAYSKGRFSKGVNPMVTNELVQERKEQVQCAYGVAVSKSGIYPCPILVDVNEAKITNSLTDAICKPVALTYSFCASCFATGSTCGQ